MGLYFGPLINESCTKCNGNDEHDPFKLVKFSLNVKLGKF
jgi:hypothetical protein